MRSSSTTLILCSSCELPTHLLPIKSKVERMSNGDINTSKAMDADAANGDEIQKSNHPTGSFLVRGYRNETMDLTWSNVNMTVKDNKGEVVKYILKDVWGSAKAGETTAIMGARCVHSHTLCTLMRKTRRRPTMHA